MIFRTKKMNRLSRHNQRRARCAAWRTIKAALISLAVVELPPFILFVQKGTFTRAEVSALLQSCAVALLMVILNYVQRLNERAPGPRRPISQSDIDHSTPPEK
jgi:hypothetical protein